MSDFLNNIEYENQSSEWISTKMLLEYWARDIWVNINVVFDENLKSDSDEWKNMKINQINWLEWWFFEIQNTWKNELRKINVTIWDETEIYDWVDSDWNLYKEEEDWNYVFYRWKRNDIKKKSSFYKWYTKYPPEYKLTLPDDLKAYELPAIIRWINKWTFWDSLPKFSATYETQAYILQTISYMYEKKENYIVNWKLTNEYKKTLKNLYLLYVENYWDDITSPFRNIEWINVFLDTLNNYKDEILNSKWKLDVLKEETYTAIINQSNWIKTWLEKYWWWNENISKYENNLNQTSNLNDLEWKVNDMLWIELDKSIFEHWKEQIFDYMTIVTTIDKDKTYTKIEELIKTKIGRFLKKVENWEELNDSEKEIVISTVYWTLRNFFINTKNSDELDKIFDLNSLQCLLWSILINVFLDKCWIKNTAVVLPSHSIMLAYVWNKKYILDLAYADKFSVDKNSKDWIKQTKVYKNWYKKISNDLVVEWRPEDVLLWWLYSNYTNNFTYIKNKFYFVDKWVFIAPEQYNLKIQKFLSYLYWWLYDKAEKEITDFLKEYPDSKRWKIFMAKLFLFKWDFDKAENLLNKINETEIFTNPNYSSYFLCKLAIIEHKDPVNTGDIEKYLNLLKKCFFYDDDAYLLLCDFYSNIWLYKQTYKYVDKVYTPSRKKSLLLKEWVVKVIDWDYDWALKYFNEILKYDKKYNYVYNNMWLVYTYKWDYDKAIECFVTEINNSGDLNMELTLDEDSLTWLLDNDFPNAYLYRNIALMYYKRWIKNWSVEDLKKSKQYYDKMFSKWSDWWYNIKFAMPYTNTNNLLFWNQDLVDLKNYFENLSNWN